MGDNYMLLIPSNNNTIPSISVRSKLRNMSKSSCGFITISWIKVISATLKNSSMPLTRMMAMLTTNFQGAKLNRSLSKVPPQSQVLKQAY